MDWIDKKGFEIIDEEYQKELAAMEAKIQAELDEKYSKQKSTNKGMEAQARKATEAQKQQEFQKLLKERTKILETSHFGEKGREFVLKRVERDEKIKAAKKRFREGKTSEPGKENLRPDFKNTDKAHKTYGEKPQEQQQEKEKPGLKKEFNSTDSIHKIEAYKQKIKERLGKSTRKEFDKKR